MYLVKRYSPLSSSVEESSIPDSQLTRKMESEGLNPSDHLAVLDYSKTGEKAKEVLKTILSSGLKIGTFLFVVFLANSGAIRNAQCLLINDTLIDALLAWMSCGLDLTVGLTVNKYLVYLGLFTSASSPWEDKDPVNKQPDIMKTVVMPDCEYTVKQATVDYVKNSTVSRVKKDICQKFTDGIALLLIKDLEWTDNERSDWRKSEASWARTIRAPGVKGLALPVLYSDLATSMSKILGYTVDPSLPFVRKDMFGSDFDLFQTELILFGSSFKWHKSILKDPRFENDRAEGWRTYQRNFVKLEHEVAICVLDHDKWSDLPYQQFQTVVKASVDYYVDKMVNKMNDLRQSSKSWKLFSGTMAEIVQCYPSILKEPWVANEAQKQWAKMRHRIAGGRVLRICKYRFAAPDMVAVVQHIIGAEVTGIIPGKRVVCSAYKANRIIGITRAPHLDNAHLLRIVIDLPQEFRGLFNGKVIYFSIHDLSMTTVQMDFDGDHVCVYTDKQLISDVKDTIKFLDNVPLYYEADEAQEDENPITQDNIKSFLMGVTPAPIGLFAWTLNKVWASVGESALPQRSLLLREIAILTKKTNLCVDDAKKKTNKTSDTSAEKVVKDLAKTPNPVFTAFAKSSPSNMVKFWLRMEKCTLYPKSHIEQYSKKCRECIPEEFVLDDNDSLKEFDWKMLLDTSARLKRIPGLLTPVGREYEGVFDAACSEHLDNYKKVQNMTDNVTALSELNKDDIDMIRCRVFAFCDGYSEAEVINSLTLQLFQRSAFKKRSDDLALDEQKRMYFMCFGQEILHNIRMNIMEDSELLAEYQNHIEKSVSEEKSETENSGMIWYDKFTIRDYAEGELENYESLDSFE